MKSLLTLICAAAALCLSAAPATQARIDVRARGEGAKGFTVADKGTTQYINHPKWMQKEKETGALVVFKMNGADWQTGTFTLTAGGAGKLILNVMGPDVRDKQTKQRIEAWVDYQKVVVNGKTIFDAKDGKPLTVWHDKPRSFFFKTDLKEGEEIKVEVTFRPTPEK